LQKLTVLLLCVTFSVCLEAASPVSLGSAGGFGVLAGTQVTSTGAAGTAITGNVGVWPGTSITGFPPAIATGAIDNDNTAAQNAQTDLLTAYNYAKTGQACGTSLSASSYDIGGATLTPGIYCVGTSLGITGNVYLNGSGVYIFQIGSSLTTAGNVILEGGATAANIFWQVGSSATIGTGSIFYGTILAEDSISVVSGAWMNGQALALTGAVTLSGNKVVDPSAPGGSLPGGGSLPPGTPAPTSLILVAIGLGCAALYQWRERLLQHFR